MLAVSLAPALADEAEATRARLAELQTLIAEIQQTQSARREEQGRLQAELRRRELGLAELARKLDTTRLAQDATKQEIAALETRGATLNAAAAEQQQAVAAEVRAAYKSGGNDQLRLLLSDDDPQTVSRVLAYYRYILGARAALVDEYRATLEALADTRRQLDARGATLETQRQQLAAQQAQQEQGRRERATLLARIEADLADDQTRLAAAQEEQSELDVLLEEIEAALAQLIPEDTVEPFSEARGAMAWPVDGRITERFGRPRNQGKMRWQGVRLEVEAGTTVSAIHHGRVVYADWLRGAGLLLVIDHGEGYMSLYAHNESLLRDVGDWVSAGAAVATVGNSGGQSEAGLYFEIRKDGKPTDPQGWCRG